MKQTNYRILLYAAGLAAIFVLLITAAYLTHRWFTVLQPRIISCNAYEVPRAAYITTLYIKKLGHAPRSYIRMSDFHTNSRSILPYKNKQGVELRYRESDIYPTVYGVNRGKSRLVISNEGTVYYTYDHYRHFVTITPACLKRFIRKAYSS